MGIHKHLNCFKNFSGKYYGLKENRLVFEEKPSEPKPAPEPSKDEQIKDLQAKIAKQEKQLRKEKDKDKDKKEKLEKILGETRAKLKKLQEEPAKKLLPSSDEKEEKRILGPSETTKTEGGENGEKMEGTFNAQNKLIEGTITFKNGDVYSGTFDPETGKLTKGKIILKSGDTQEGDFDKTTSRLTKGRKKLASGETQEGDFDKDTGKLTKGKIVLISGVILDGTFDRTTGQIMEGTKTNEKGNPAEIQKGKWEKTGKFSGVIKFRDGTIRRGTWDKTGKAIGTPTQVPSMEEEDKPKPDAKAAPGPEKKPATSAETTTSPAGKLFEGYAARVEKIDEKTKGKDKKVLGNAKIPDIRSNIALLTSDKKADTVKEKAVNLKEETDRRIRAYTSRYDSKTGKYTLDYEGVKRSHEISIGLGDILLDPDIKEVEIWKDREKPIIAKRATVATKRNKERVGFVDKDGDYVTTFTGDKFRIVTEKERNFGNKDELTAYHNETEKERKQRQKFEWFSEAGEKSARTEGKEEKTRRESVAKVGKTTPPVTPPVTPPATPPAKTGETTTPSHVEDKKTTEATKEKSPEELAKAETIKATISKVQEKADKVALQMWRDSIKISETPKSPDSTSYAILVEGKDTNSTIEIKAEQVN
ncbi:hypothetical protein HZC20_02360, partial [Candidatus Peregrinibacteria bacterium]|nr:hypothetical protein [Candidatus Peregrinibacteria bacterium]